MAIQDENPWSFERDEIDILEEDIDEFYKTHELSQSHTLQELLEIEVQVAAEPQPEIEQENFSQESVKELLRARSYRQPLYERVYVWSQKVSALAFQFYEKDCLSEDAFIAHVVAKLIPIKPSLIYFSQILEALRNLSETFGDDWMQLYEEGLKIKSVIEKERI